MVTKAYTLLQGRNDIKAWLDLGIKIYGYLLNHLVDVHEIWLGDDAIRGDLDAIISNPIASTILKCLRFKFKIFSLAQQWVGIIRP
jgi:hypothetical protein